MKYIDDENKLKFDDEIVVYFVNIVRKVVQKEIQTYFKSLNIETFIDLSVVSISNNGLNATLKDLVTKEIYENIPNNTGLMLNVGDIVRMYKGDNYSYIGQTLETDLHKRTQYLCQDTKEGNK